MLILPRSRLGRALHKVYAVAVVLLVLVAIARAAFGF